MTTLILNDYQVTLLEHAIFNYRNLLKDEAHGGESNVILVQDAINGNYVFNYLGGLN